MNKIVLCCLCAALLPSGAIAQLSQISVKGNHFVTADGKPIVFRGLDASDPEKLERNGQWNKQYVEEAKAWGANVLRFPVHPAAWRMRGKDNYLKLLDQGVSWAKEAGLYVIIDWHSMGNLCSELFPPGYSELYPPALYNTTRKMPPSTAGRMPAATWWRRPDAPAAPCFSSWASCFQPLPAAQPKAP